VLRSLVFRSANFAEQFARWWGSGRAEDDVAVLADDEDCAGYAVAFGFERVEGGRNVEPFINKEIEWERELSLER
jgi:hypothetical protein